MYKRQLGRWLNDDMVSKSKRRVYVYQTSGRVEYDEFYLKLSKPIIDEIDIALAGGGKQVLFLVPSLSLMSQTITEWTIQSKTASVSYTHLDVYKRQIFPHSAKSSGKCSMICSMFTLWTSIS